MGKGAIATKEFMKSIAISEVLTLKSEVAYQPGQVASKTLAQNDALSAAQYKILPVVAFCRQKPGPLRLKRPRFFILSITSCGSLRPFRALLQRSGAGGFALGFLGKAVALA